MAIALSKQRKHRRTHLGVSIPSQANIIYVQKVNQNKNTKATGKNETQWWDSIRSCTDRLKQKYRCSQRRRTWWSSYKWMHLPGLQKHWCRMAEGSRMIHVQIFKVRLWVKEDSNAEWRVWIKVLYVKGSKCISGLTDWRYWVKMGKENICGEGDVYNWLCRGFYHLTHSCTVCNWVVWICVHREFWYFCNCYFTISWTKNKEPFFF